MTSATQPNVETIRRGLGEDASDTVDIHVFDRLESTSQWLSEQRSSFDAQLANGRVQLCVTDWQQAGVGRRGKRWQTQPGNVTFSILSRVSAPAAQLLGLSLVTGIAVAEELKRRLGLEIMLKWPNDVIYDNRKLGGLLTEIVSVPQHESPGVERVNMSLSGKGVVNVLTDVITGIGININHDDSVLALGIGATSIKQAGIDVLQDDRDALVGGLCASVMASHSRFIQHQWEPFRQAWSQRDWLEGKDVSIHRDDSTEHAVACGVNEQGALLVKSEGTLKPLYGGNVSIRPTV